MRSKKAMLASVVVAAGAIIGIGQVTDTFPVVGSACSCPTPTFTPGNTVAPVATGTPQVGQGVLAATDGTWTHNPTSYSYTWQTSPTGAGSWTTLTTGSNTYTLVNGDIGNYIRIEVVATNSVGSATADSNVLGPIVAPGGGGGGGGDPFPSYTNANIWVDSVGSDNGTNCNRHSVASTEQTAASVCKTLNKAYTLAQCGDTILVKGGSYAQQIMLESGNKTCTSVDATPECHNAAVFPDGTTQTADYSECVFIAPKSGDTVTMASLACGSGVACPGSESALIVNVSFVYMTGFTVLPTNSGGGTTVNQQLGLYVSYTTRSSSTNCTNSLVKESVFNDFTGPQFFLQNVDNVALTNSDFGPAWSVNSFGIANQVSDCANPNGSGQYRNTDKVQLVGNNIHDIVTPSGVGGQHDTCLHWNGGGNFIIAKNTFNNCTQTNISFQSTVSQTVPSMNYGLIENNTFGDPCADATPPNAPAAACSVVEGGGVTFRCGYLNDMENIIIRYNSFQRYLNFTHGNPSQCQDTTTWPTNHGFQIYANVAERVNGATAYPTNYVQGYNVWTAIAGSGTDIGSVGGTTDALYTNTAATTYDYSLATATYADSAVCAFGAGAPATDILGVTRPVGSGCSPGAYER